MVSAIPGAARDLVRAVIEAVEAATGGADVVTYDSATALLAARPMGGRVLGDVLRLLLEDTHPDGLDSADIALVIGRCYRAAATWLPPERVDVAMLLTVLASALGIQAAAVTAEALDPPRPDADGTSTAILTPPDPTGRRGGPTTRGMRRCW
jgi:hypothetical protein